MSKQHIVTVYQDANGQHQATPHQLEVYHNDSVMFFCEDLDIAVVFGPGDCPFGDDIFFVVQAASYMSPESVIEKPPKGSRHQYTIFTCCPKSQVVQKIPIDPVVIVDPYPLEETVKAALSKQKNQK